MCDILVKLVSGVSSGTVRVLRLESDGTRNVRGTPTTMAMTVKIFVDVLEISRLTESRTALRARAPPTTIEILLVSSMITVGLTTLVVFVLTSCMTLPLGTCVMKLISYEVTTNSTVSRGNY